MKAKIIEPKATSVSETWTWKTKVYRSKSMGKNSIISHLRTKSNSSRMTWRREMLSSVRCAKIMIILWFRIKPRRKWVFSTKKDKICRVSLINCVKSLASPSKCWRRRKKRTQHLKANWKYTKSSNSHVIWRNMTSRSKLAKDSVKKMLSSSWRLL